MRTPYRSRRRRTGATLVELLIAILLFDLSLLTLVAVSAVAVRSMGTAGRRNRAALAATSRIEWMSSLSCTSVLSGTAALERGVTERWAATRIVGARELVDSIHVDSRRSEDIVLRGRAAC